MKKFYLIALFALVCNFASAQIESVAYRGAFAPAPAAMWTDSWTNWSPKTTEYADSATVVNVTTDITVNTTWTADKTYKLTGLIYVRNNATLTIQAGTLVKGVYTSSGTALIVTKGAKLNAIGTAAAPIVFTSGKTVAQGRSAGDWGGVVLLGKARFTSLGAANTGVNYIEGITSSVNTEYGGGSTPDDADNSGTLKYVRIEFGGFVFSNNNEINGLTMGAVGNGTTIDYVQTSYTNDDSFEWFGGSVNCKHLVAYRGLDDDFDADNGYKGAVQFALGIKDPSLADNPVVSTSEGFEVDNNATGVVAQSGWDATSCIFSNCTLIGPSGRGASSIASGHERPLRLRRAAQVKIYNSIFQDFKSNYLFIDGSLTQGNATAASPTLKFKNNIIAGTASSTYTSGVRGSSSTTATAASELSTWFSTNNNSYVASSGILAAPYSASPLTDYTGDFRPGTLAATGASFTDASLAALLPQIGTGTTPTVVNRSHCKGALGLSPLSAQLTSDPGDATTTPVTAPFTGVSLRWYTSATTTTFTTTAPTPTSGTPGVKTYYVAQVDAAGNASSRVPLTVTILAAPTIGLGAIKGAVDPVTSIAAVATVNVGLYLGTTTAFTYSVATSTDPTVSTYLWTVPSGVNIVSGQGTNTLVVNYLNVPAGAGFVGTITAQGVNANSCAGAASKLVIKKALATAPSLKMYDKNSAKPTTPLTSFGQFAGTTTPVTLVSSTVVTATGYQWELPAGVSLVTGSITPVTTTATFTAEPFLTTNTAPTTVGTKYWVVTYNTYTGVDVNGVATTIVTSTAEQKIYGTGNASPKTLYGGTTSAPYLAYGTVITSNLPSIIVNFAGASASIFNELYLGVKSVNGVGSSIKNNNTTTNATAIANNVPGMNYTIYTETVTAAVAPVSPSTIGTNATSTYAVSGTTPSTATLLKVVSVAPLAPALVKSLNGLTSVIDISTYVGTDKSLTLTCSALANASSYTWTLPTGVNVTAGATQVGTETSPSTWKSITNSITVNYDGIASGTATVAINVKANNNVNSSADKLLTLTAAAPATPAIPTGSLAICPSAATSVTYTIAAVPAKATKYLIEAPEGATVTSNSVTGTYLQIDAVANATFTMNYAEGFISTTAAPKYIYIFSGNGFGGGAIARSLKLTNATSGCPTSPRFSEAAVANEFSVVAYPNPSSSEFTIETSAKGAINAKVYDMQGRLVENANSTQVGSSLAPGVYNVIVSQGANTKSVRVIKK